MIGVVDSTLGQFSADVLLVVLVVVNACAGWRTGTLRRMLVLLGVYVGFLAAFYTGGGVAAVIHKDDLFVNAWAFVAVFAVAVLVFELLGAVFGDRINRVAVVTFDRVAGLIVGGFVGFLQALVAFMVALAVGAASPAPGNTVPASRDAAANSIRSSTLSSRAIRAEPALRGLVAPIVGSDLTGHLVGAAQLGGPHP